MSEKPRARPRYQGRPCLVLFGAAACGVLADRIFPLPILLWWSLGAVCLAGGYACSRRPGGRSAACLLLLAAGGFSASWHHRQWFLFDVNELAFRAPREGRHSVPVCVEGIVQDQPREMSRLNVELPAGDPMEWTRLGLRATRIREGQQWQAVSGIVTVTVPGRTGAIGAGDRVRIWAHLRRIRGPMNPGELDWRMRLRGVRQLCSLRAPHPECIRKVRPAGWHPSTWLGRLRAHCDQVLARHLAPDPYRLAAAILLGARGSLTHPQSEAFFRSGTVHLLAISGLHLGMVAGGFLAAARGQVLPRRSALVGVIVLVAVYAALTEGRAPVVRAAVLAHVICLSWWTRRRTSVLNSLGAAALVVLARNPNHLFQTGAQLSFLAVGTLAALAPHLALRPPADPLQRLIWRTRPWWWRGVRATGQRFGQMVAASAMVWVATVPLVQHHFHIVSPVAIGLNLVLWIPVALVLFSGYGLLLCDGICPLLASWFGSCCELNLIGLQRASEIACRWPMAYSWSSGPGVVWLVLFYLVWSLLLCLPARRQFWTGCTLAAVAWWVITLGVGMVPRVQPHSGVRVTFLSVGHGTCVLLEFPRGETLLYDCGRRGSTSSAVDTVARFLWSRRIRSLDGVVLSHADADHFNLLPGILERFPVRAVFVPPGMFQDPGPSLAAVQRQLLEAGVRVHQVRAPERLPIPTEGRSRILHPPRAVSPGHDNANSLVLLYEQGRNLLLLPGDLEGAGLEQLLQRPVGPVAVVMAPHHGSPNSRPAEFIAWSQASVFIVSGEESPNFEMLAARSADRSCRLFHTALDGAIDVVIDGDTIQVTSFLAPRR